ncbi:hypothetical protein G6F31_021249 [Rhizopus arrhizus]|nr:hypothetical protein G6F31_021249 [Rhizopus arrhizus]
MNASVALWTTWLFRTEIRRPGEKAIRACVVIGFLALGFIYSSAMTAWAETGLYGDDVVHAETTPYQRLVVTLLVARRTPLSRIAGASGPADAALGA